MDVARINASNAIERVYNLPLPHTRLMVAKGDYIYTIGNSTDAITEDRQTGINVLDITTREIPKLIKTIPIDNINKMDILQWQNQLVVAADSTLYFFDISDPENPRDDGFMDLSYLTYGPENIRPKPKKLVLLDDNKMAVAFSCLGWMIFDLENRTIIKHFVK